MKNTAIAAMLLVMLAVPLTAALPPSAEALKAELTRRKKKVAVPVAVPTVQATPSPAPTPMIEPGSFEGRLLAAHNIERKRLGIAPLTWNRALSSQAAQWATTLASKGLFEHSQNRGNVGENLWMGTSGYYTPEQMIGAFIGERQYFRPGKFPDVSSTGKWADVGHYTQLIWPGTQQLGCAKATGAGKDVLVCRYFPAGNVMGQRVP
ncbi:CAP domain-containing protein [Novosphingobium sp.]|uniref:CAP domain-containing protein n=1 Tax=Novosphingobium sp. TaxID=1874826 RepID=UPI00286C2B4E|nr:CAP domain-containing protein [Novosphingobium sp.]